MAALGRVIFYWSRLEAALHNGAKPVGALEAEIRHLRAKRNIIVHGLCGGATDPVAGTGALRCKRNHNPADLRPDTVFTLTDLQDLAEAMDKCRIRLERRP